MWEPLLPLIPDVGAFGLLALTVWLVLTGRIVARSWVDKLIERTDSWQRIAEKAMETNAAHAQANRELADLVRRALDAAARKDPVP